MAATRALHVSRLPVVALVGFVYLALMLGVSALADNGRAPLASATGLGGLALIHFVLGSMVARWWVLLLVPAAIGIAALFGEAGASANSEVSLWVGLLIRAPLLVGFVLLGMLARAAISRARRTGAGPL